MAWAGTERLARWYVVAAFAWVGRYLTLGTVPWWHPPLWAGWFDQSRYLRSAVALAHGVLLPAEHWYPLLYPLAAVPFAWASPSDPFVLLDLALYLLTCGAFRRVAIATGLGSGTAMAVFLLTTIAQTGLASAWVHPWTSTLSAALTWWLLVALLRLREPEANRWLVVGIGALAAAIPLVRPVDALTSVAAGLAVVALCDRRRALPSIALMAGGAALVVLPYAGLYLAIYGWAPTPYMTAAARTGFVPMDLGWKAYTLLVDAADWYPGARAVLRVLPWVVGGVAGLVTRYITHRADRPVILLFSALFVPGAVLTLTYADLQPPGLWAFTNIHYWKALLPMLGLGAVWWVEALLTPAGRPVALAAVAAAVAVLGFRIEPVAVDDGVPARMLVYRGRTGRDWAAAYFAPVIIRDRRGAMATVNAFHQVPAPDGERELAVRRLFDRAPRRFDPADSPATQGALPYRRYGEAVSWFGVPLGQLTMRNE